MGKSMNYGIQIDNMTKIKKKYILFEIYEVRPYYSPSDLCSSNLCLEIRIYNAIAKMMKGLLVLYSSQRDEMLMLMEGR